MQINLLGQNFVADRNSNVQHFSNCILFAFTCIKQLPPINNKFRHKNINFLPQKGSLFMFTQPLSFSLSKSWNTHTRTHTRTHTHFLSLSRSCPEFIANNLTAFFFNRLSRKKFDNLKKRLFCYLQILF